ncbi:anion transporter [Acidobacteria bacterium Mor1]|nr:anion transporter [Acidobacteria bacterium Mor1]
MSAPEEQGSRARRIGRVLGPALALVLLALAPPEGLGLVGLATAALGVWMAVWWATEAVPIPVTALLPLGLMPLLGIADIRTAAAPYAHPTIFLFLGGFLVALALQRWDLHRRVALWVVEGFGRSGNSLILGFMLAAALISMWVTNTATTMMLLPIATSVILVVMRSARAEERDERSSFPVALLLGVAYGASIGGVATLIGTPPNALLAAFMREQFDVEIGFARWLLLGLPVSGLMLPAAWWLLTRRLFTVRFTTGPRTREHLAELRRELGPIGTAERRVAAVFLLLAIAWVTRPLLNRVELLAGLSDAGIAMLVGALLFVIPSGNRGALLSWEDTEKLPWGVLILFGGGLSLASAVSNSGLAAWMGSGLQATGIESLPLTVLLAAALIIFLTELTSNTATAATFLPVLAALAVESGHPAIALTAPVALAASLAFMLPVATPPNAVVFSSGQVRIGQMMRAGLWLNLVGILLVTAAAVLLAPRVFG